VNHTDGGQDVPEKLVLKKVVTQDQDGAALVLRKDEPWSGGSRNLPIKSSKDVKPEVI